MAVGDETYAAITDLIVLLNRLGKANQEPFIMRFGLKA
jgi:hypothetical protein